jgi:hypothetical protein
MVGSALEAVEELSAIGHVIQGLIAEGRACRIGIRDGFFVYAATHPDTPDDTFSSEYDPPTI